jgi:hypothetical protein
MSELGITGDFAAYAAIAAVITPYVVALLKNLGKWEWPGWAIKLLAVVIAGVGGVVAWAAANDVDDLTVGIVLANTTAIWTASQVVYAKLVGDTKPVEVLSALGDSSS